jgi:Ca-activated chloride channel family protein
MRFENPLAAVYIFWSIPLMILFWFIIMRRRKQLIGKFIARPLLPEIAASLNIRKEYLKAALISAAIIFLLLALTRPQLGFRWEEFKQQGLDVIFAVDTSKSMLAEDIRPNRLERTKLAIQDMIGRLRGDRIGLIAFSGEAFLLCPLTLDYGGFLLGLQDLSIDTIPRGGTSVSLAIREATKVFEPGEKRYRVMVLVSDGEEHEGHAIKAAEEAKKEMIKIFCIGVGSKRGDYIPIIDEKGNKSFLLDKSGRRVKTYLNEDLLKKIAFITNGAYVHSTITDFGLGTIYREKISTLEKREVTAKKRKYYHERFQIPLVLAIILLCLESIITSRKGRR